HVVLQLVEAAGAVVLLLGEVVVGARHLVVGAAMDDGVGPGAVGAVLGGERQVGGAADARAGGDAHLVEVGVGGELPEVGDARLPAEAADAGGAGGLRR